MLEVQIKNSVRQADSEIHRQELEFTIYQQRITIEATKAYFQTLSSQGMVEQYQALLQQGEEDLEKFRPDRLPGLVRKWRHWKSKPGCWMANKNYPNPKPNIRWI